MANTLRGYFLSTPSAPIWLKFLGSLLVLLGAIGATAFHPGQPNEPWFLVLFAAGLIVITPRPWIAVVVTSLLAIGVAGATLRPYLPDDKPYGLIETYNKAVEVTPDDAERYLSIVLEQWGADTIEEAEVIATEARHQARNDVLREHSVILWWALVFTISGTWTGYALLNHRRAWENAPSRWAGILATLFGAAMISFLLAPGVLQTVGVIQARL